MKNIRILLLIVAIVCFIVAGVGRRYQNDWAIHIGWIGMAFFAGAVLTHDVN